MRGPNSDENSGQDGGAHRKGEGKEPGKERDAYSAQQSVDKFDDQRARPGQAIELVDKENLDAGGAGAFKNGLAALFRGAQGGDGGFVGEAGVGVVIGGEDGCHLGDEGAGDAQGESGRGQNQKRTACHLRGAVPQAQISKNNVANCSF